MLLCPEGVPGCQLPTGGGGVPGGAALRLWTWQGVGAVAWRQVRGAGGGGGFRSPASGLPFGRVVCVHDDRSARRRRLRIHPALLHLTADWLDV